MMKTSFEDGKKKKKHTHTHKGDSEDMHYQKGKKMWLKKTLISLLLKPFCLPHFQHSLENNITSAISGFGESSGLAVLKQKKTAPSLQFTVKRGGKWREVRLCHGL